MTTANRFRFRRWDTTRQQMLPPIDLSTLKQFSSECSVEWLQSTGLCDKDGKEIFEGDILKYGTSDLLYRVAWEAPEFVLYDYPDFHGGDGWTPWPEHKDRSSIALEVIGNIYQNSDQLE